MNNLTIKKDSWLNTKCRPMLRKKHLGMTVVELLVVVAILAILFFSVFSWFSLSTEAVDLIADTDNIVFLLTKARSDTLASRDGSVFGVHFESGKAVLFAGESYFENALGNTAVILSPRISIDDISIFGEGSDLVFNRLDGTTDQFGFVNIAVTGGSNSKRINISNNGIINVE